MRKSLQFAIVIFWCVLGILLTLSFLFLKKPNPYLSGQNKEKKPQQTDNLKKDVSNQPQDQITQDQNLNLSNTKDEPQANSPDQESSDKFYQSTTETDDEQPVLNKISSIASSGPKSSPSQHQPIVPPVVQEKSATVQIAQLGSFKVDLQGQDTAFTILKRAGTENSFEVKYQWYDGLGAFIECLGGICSKNNYYWIFYYNGKFSNVGTSSQEVKAGDVMTWKFEKM